MSATSTAVSPARPMRLLRAAADQLAEHDDVLAILRAAGRLLRTQDVLEPGGVQFNAEDVKAHRVA